MGAAIGIIYFVGLLATAGVQRHRAGISQVGKLGIELTLMSLAWAGLSIAKMLAWPAVLAVWLAQGRPPSPWECTVSSTGSLRVRRVPTRALAD